LWSAFARTPTYSSRQARKWVSEVPTKSATWPSPRWPRPVSTAPIRPPTKLTDDLVAQADIVVALKPGLDLPHLDGVRYETWPLPDPAEWDIDGVRPHRDYIDTKVQQLLLELAPPRTT
jgi:hypothetical protein